MLLTEARRAHYHRDGFIKGPRVLDDAMLASLRSELSRVISQQAESQVAQPLSIRNRTGDDEHPVWQVINIWEASPAYRALLNIPGLGATIQALISGREIRLWHDQIQFKPEAIGGATMWHQDWPYWPTMSAPHAVTAWIALDDADPDNGCMSMVPGSHRWGNSIGHLHGLPRFDAVPAQYQGQPSPVQVCPVAAGEVHFHHCMTWHGSPDNTSARPRRAIALHFMNEQVTKVPGDMHPCSHYCESADGEPIRGAHFPLIWSADGVPGQALAPVEPAALVGAASR